MNDETNELLFHTIKKLRPWARFKNKIRALLLSDSDIRKMKSALIAQVKPVFARSRKDPRDEMDRLSVDCFEERIETLPKWALLDLYTDLMQMKSAKSEEAKRYLWQSLLINLNLCYSLNGWFRLKLFEYGRTGRI